MNLNERPQDRNALDAISDAIAEAQRNDDSRVRTCTFTCQVSWDEKGVKLEALPSTNDFENDDSMPGGVKMLVADLMVKAAGIVYQLGERQAHNVTRSGIQVVGHRGPLRGLN